jgi:hypothetical protein
LFFFHFNAFFVVGFTGEILFLDGEREFDGQKDEEVEREGESARDCRSFRGGIVASL